MFLCPWSCCCSGMEKLSKTNKKVYANYVGLPIANRYYNAM
jgi:hypothetical protein